MVTAVRPSDRGAGRVSIVRDRWGVPHIFAEREADAFFGVGYAQAQDRLRQLLLAWLRARGELAAAFGHDHVATDVRHRRWRHLEEARHGLAQLSEPLQAAYAAFAAGVERYMAEHPTVVPSWAPDPDPALILALERARRWPASGERDGLEACAASGVPIFDDLAGEPVLPDAAQASNAWALAPPRTTDGSTILLGDPHAGAFDIRFEFTVHAGRLHASGHANVGGALPILAHTRHVAWAWTTGAPRVGDCYALELDPQHPDRYRYDGGWKAMQAEHARIAVRGGPSVAVRLEYSDHNGVRCPVVARAGDRAYVIATPYMHATALWHEQLYRQLLARDVDELRATMGMLGMHAENVVACDAAGGLLYVRNGRVPLRPSGADWRRPLDGTTSATRWRGLRPIDDLIQVIRPAAGFVQNNNVAPDAMYDDGSLRGRGPLDERFNDEPGRTTTRGLRALELLGGDRRLSREDAVDVALDERWVTAAAWQRALAASWPPGGDRGDRDAFVRDLLAFDGFARPESRAAARFFFWRRAMGELAPAALEALSDRVEALYEPRLLRVAFDPRTVSPAAGRPGGLSAAQRRVLVAAVDAAIETMTTRYGSTDVRYSDVFRIGAGGTSFPVRGGDLEVGEREDQPLRVIWCAPDRDNREWHAYGGGHALRLVAFTPEPRAFSVVLHGQSDDPRSPHRSDQARLVGERALKPVPFFDAEIAAAAQSTITLAVDSEKG